MAKFVKLENETGTYLNVDQIITIDKYSDHTNYIAHTLGFDNEWEAHSVELTDNDLKRILAATGSDNDSYDPSQGPAFEAHTPSKHVVELAIEALREQAAQYQDIESKLKGKKDAGYPVEQNIANVQAKLKEIWGAEKKLGVYRSQLELGIIH